MKFKNLDDLWKSIEKLNMPLDKELYERLCAEYRFNKGKSDAFVYADIYPDKIHDLGKLLSYMFLFETDRGEKYYVVNTSLWILDITKVLKKYNLEGFMGACSFIGDRDRTVVVFEEEKIYDLYNRLDEYIN